MNDVPSWPIIIISTTNTFLHVGKSLESLQKHIITDTESEHSPRDLELEFFDSRCRVLTPVPNRAWVPVEFRVSPYWIDESVLLKRIETAIASAEEFAQQRKAALDQEPLTPQDIAQLTGPKPAEGDTVEKFVTALVNHVSYTGGDLGDGIPEDHDTGGWLHNAWHAAFG